MEKPSFFQELKRRSVIRVGAAYVVTAWLLIQVAETIFPLFGYDETPARIIVVVLAIGLIPALVLSWVYELTSEGIKKEKDIDRSESSAHSTGRKLDFAIIALLAIALLVIAGSWYGGRHERWARDVAIPQIQAHVDGGDWESAYALAKQVRERAPGYEGLEELWHRFSWVTTIPSEPAGATVFRRPYDDPDAEWKELGSTPLTDIRFPFGLSIVRFVVDDRPPLLRLMGGEQSTSNRPDLRVVDRRPYFYTGRFFSETFRIDDNDTLPYGMVRVPGWGPSQIEQSVFGLRVVTSDFFIDRYEVTNHEYKQFVDAGGYQNPDYWTHDFSRDGVRLTWAEAMALLVDRSGRPGPSTWVGGTFAAGEGNHPVAGVSWYEAEAYARYVGLELPTYYHWRRAISEGAMTWMLPASNLDASGAAPVGEFGGMAWTGAYDLAGNVREWCSTASGDERVILGAGWNDTPYVVLESILDASSLPALDRSPTNGLRLAKTNDDPDVAEVLRTPVTIESESLDAEPVSDEVFAVFRNLFNYDDAPLNAVVEIEEYRGPFKRQYITFDAPYGDERTGLYLYLPSDGDGPFQTIIYWGGMGIQFTDSIDRNKTPIEFVLRAGRAVAVPVYKGTFQRRIDGRISWATIAGRDLAIQEVKELRRSIDYLETRDDIEADKLGYFGYSWGGRIGPIALAIEDRLKVAVFDQAGLQQLWHPETSVVNYLPRVSQPVLQFNGEYDTDFRYETSAKPFFELLGSTEKLHIKEPTAHFVSRVTVIGNTLDWFDKYLGDSD